MDGTFGSGGAGHGRVCREANRLRAALSARSGLCATACVCLSQPAAHSGAAFGHSEPRARTAPDLDGTTTRAGSGCRVASTPAAASRNRACHAGAWLCLGPRVLELEWQLGLGERGMDSAPTPACGLGGAALGASSTWLRLYAWSLAIRNPTANAAGLGSAVGSTLKGIAVGRRTV